MRKNRRSIQGIIPIAYWKIIFEPESLFTWPLSPVSPGEWRGIWAEPARGSYFHISCFCYPFSSLPIPITTIHTIGRHDRFVQGHHGRTTVLCGCPHYYKNFHTTLPKRNMTFNERGREKYRLINPIGYEILCRKIAWHITCRNY